MVANIEKIDYAVLSGVDRRKIRIIDSQRMEEIVGHQAHQKQIHWRKYAQAIQRSAQEQ